MKLSEWLAANVTDDTRALRWFDGPEAEERIIRCYKQLLSGYEVDTETILNTTRMLEPDERPGRVTVDHIGFHSIC